MSDYRHNRAGRGQANFGHGNTNVGRDHIDGRIDNRGGHYAGRDYRQVHNHGMYAERDLHYRDGDYYDIQHSQGDPFDDIASGRGVGRLITVVGLLIALAGFGGFMYVIFRGFTADEHMFDPTSITVLEIPLMFVGFGAALVGGIIASAGGAMARASRRRHDRAAHYRRRRY
ncbi:hypothetical protein [Actinophytocola xanthii]|uniref:Uncharacterized protein n=1 Tax=Actinophytocola xanthii TaxID=1912961 RepID=A0A1Q8CXD2_9PSEU|nr:hypothetical protein [Actinophytocola xanthii]OLF19018.1 hypothetical protein BU204_03985 [Actinophytocola xanthii]